MRAPILRPGAVVVSRFKRELLDVADGLHFVGGNAERDQIVLRGERATLTEREVVFGGATFVAVPLDRDLPRGVLLHDPGVLLQHPLSFGTDVRAVELEE